MFNFFKIVPLNRYVNQKNKIISYCNNFFYKVFCTADEVQIFSKDWECITLQLNDIQFCCISDNSDLILLSQHSVTRKIIIKVYNVLNQLSRKHSIPFINFALECNSEVTALGALNTDPQLCLAIGLGNGNILFYKNAAHKEIPNAFKCYNVCSKQIKGIKFTKKKQKDVSMFVCSDAGVFCYTICNNLSLSETKLTLDDMNSSVHCCTSKSTLELGGEQYFVVARDDGLYCYTAEGRGPCYALNGHKKSVDCCGKSLIVELKINKTFNLQQSKLIIIDIENKIIVLNKKFDSKLYVLPGAEQSCCLILLNGGIFALREHELKYKLSHLIKKKLYDIALKFLEESKANFDIHSEVLVHYGDHLLQRGDSTRAVKIFSKTIGTISPFLIIRKLMNFRYNEHLIHYLSNLVKTECKIVEHEELLANCFRRIELPASTFRIFEIKESKFRKLYVSNAALNNCERTALILTTVLQNRNIPVNFFNELNNPEILNFFFEYGYYLNKYYPNEIKDLIKYLLSNHFLKNYIFHRIILSLSLMNKLCAIDFIDIINKDCEQESTYNIWTELILKMWHKGDIDIQFVVDFLKIHESEISMDNLFILCRNYKFWPGIKMMYDKYSMEVLSTRCLVKCFETFPLYMNKMSLVYTCQEFNHNWIRTLKENLTTNYSFKFVADVVKNIINCNPYYIMTIIDGFVTNNEFLLSNLNEFLLYENCFNHYKCDELNTFVLLLEKKVIHMEGILHNYLKKPIEFRNRNCDTCNQMIKQPSVYFLCQHSYHRECIRQYSGILVCNVCTDGQIAKKEIKQKKQLYNTTDNLSNKSSLLLDIPRKIGQCFLDFGDKDLNTNNQQYCNMELSKSIENNPFNEYD